MAIDVIVVGGGTAGCAVAARLSEDPSREVLLLEAGNDYTSRTLPPTLADVRYVPMRGHFPDPDPQHDWGLELRTRDGASVAVPQGRTIGGGSAINGSIALRGATADYREWSAAGNPRWSWDDVLPAFRALEDDTAEPTAVHGRGGPFTIERSHHQEYGRLQEAFVRSCDALGQPSAWDLNAPDAHGYGPVPMARRGTRRLSTAGAYLDPARDRANLSVRGGALVSQVLVEDGQARGVRLADGEVLRAGEVILTAGAIITPALLQRSGVGPADLLQELSIPVVADLPVGDNLLDHFVFPLLSQPRPGAWTDGDFSLQTALRTSSTVQPDTLDMQLLMFSYLNVRTTGADGGTRGIAGAVRSGEEHVAGVGCVLNKPRGSGTVRLTSTDPNVLPAVEPNFLEHPTDREVVRELLRLGWDVFHNGPLAELLDAPAGIDEATLADDGRLDQAAKGMIASAYHFAGTCRMGPHTDPASVVDEEGRVHGCEGLRVADASIMPTVPAANTMLPTLMVAERIAGAIAGRGLEGGRPI